MVLEEIGGTGAGLALVPAASASLLPQWELLDYKPQNRTAGTTIGLLPTQAHSV